MAMEVQRQQDDTATTQLLIQEAATIAKRGQIISGILAVGALIGGIYLVTIGEVTLGSLLLLGDASFVAFNTIRDQQKNEE